MNRRPVTSIALAAVAVGCLCGRIATAQDQKPNPVLPVFEVDSHFPTMPDHMLLGGVGGATADSHGNVWVFHRPHTLEEGNATENGYVPAQSVLQFTPTGRYIQGWGGPIKGGPYQWFNRGGLHSAFAECASCTMQRRLNGDGRPGSGEHGITVDADDNVWLTGNGDSAAADFGGKALTCASCALFALSTPWRVLGRTKVQKSTIAASSKTVDRPRLCLLGSIGTLSERLRVCSASKIAGLSGRLRPDSTGEMGQLSGCAGAASFRLAGASPHSFVSGGRVAADGNRNATAS